MSEINRFIERLESNSEQLKFDQVIDLIDRHYNFEPTKFSNGSQENAAGENSGSCKVLSFARLNNLVKEQALKLFAQYYRDVLATPGESDHQNIRQFIEHGYDGLTFEGQALSLKAEPIS